MGQDDLDVDRGTVTSLQKGSLPSLHSLASTVLNQHGRGGSGPHPFVISVEETVGRPLPAPTNTTVLEDKLAEERAGEEKAKSARNLFNFLSLRKPRRFLPRLPALSTRNDTKDNFELFQVVNRTSAKRKGDLASLHSFGPATPRLPRLREDITDEDLTTLSTFYTFINARDKDKAAGDFTSVTFEIDDIENDNPDDDFSRPNTHPRESGQNEVWVTSAGAGVAPFLSFTPTVFGGLALPPIENHRISGGENILLPQNLESWMKNLPLELQKVPLNHLFIPGSHDSFSYSLTSEEELGPDAPGVVSALNKCCPCLARPAILRWSVTQQVTATQQLKHGIRYFDIRVAVRSGRFYFVHGLFGGDLEPLLSEIRHFLVKHPGEVTLLDFQHLHGLKTHDHSALVNLLKNTFSELICPFSHQLHNVTLSYLARFKYQVLIFYRHQETMQGVSWLWPSSSLPNPWPNTTSVSGMFAFLEKHLQERSPDAFFVTQCVLTPSTKYLVRHFSGELETMAESCNDALPEWIAQLPVGPRGPNIVMTDFVEYDSWAVPRAVIRRNAFGAPEPARPARF